MSQFYEWLPYNTQTLDEVPKDPQARRDWLAEQTRVRLRKQADRFRPQLVQCYGPERDSRIEFAEAFEPCEYGSPLDEPAMRRLFPFVFA